MAPLSKNGFEDAAEKFRCDSFYAFKLAFGMDPMAVADVWNLMDLPDWAEPVHLLLTLNNMTDISKIGGLPIAVPTLEDYPVAESLAINDSITKLYDSLVSLKVMSSHHRLCHQ